MLNRVICVYCRMRWLSIRGLTFRYGLLRVGLLFGISWGIRVRRLMCLLLGWLERGWAEAWWGVEREAAFFVNISRHEMKQMGIS